MERQRAFHYRDRAESFLRLARLGTNRELIEEWLEERLVDYEDGVGLLAVHAGIAFADALLIHLMGNRSTAQAHHEATAKLRQACADHRLNPDGINHFGWLLSKKDIMAYGDRRVPSVLVRSALDHAQKLAEWIYRIAPELAE